MKGVRVFFMATILLLVTAIGHAQDSDMPELTPEYEAAKQTENLQRELQLNAQQADLIYRINLKYALQRQQSENRREDAMVRMKNKNNDYRKVLTDEQYSKLEERRLGVYERALSAPVSTTYRTANPQHIGDTVSSDLPPHRRNMIFRYVSKKIFNRTDSTQKIDDFTTTPDLIMEE